MKETTKLLVAAKLIMPTVYTNWPHTYTVLVPKNSNYFNDSSSHIKN